MKLNKIRISVVIVLTLVSLVGLVVIQVHWLNKSIDTNRHIFKQKTDSATELIGKIYREDHDMIYEIHNAITSTSQDDDYIINAFLSKIIDSSFTNFNLPLNYTYGIYAHTDNDLNVFVYGNTLETHINHRSENRTFSWTQLACNIRERKDNNYHLAIFPSSYDTYVFDQIKGSLFTSVLFILLVLFGFFYTLITIKKQKRLSDIKNDFINNLTHEFKTPIFSIKLAASALKKQISLSDKSQNTMTNYIDVIDHEGERLKDQVDRILQLSLLNTDTFKLDKQETEINSLTQNVIDSFQILLIEKRGSISFVPSNTPITISVDKVHLSNVIYNLIDNAIKYNDEKPHIEIAVSSDKSNVFVEIKDNGIGIKTEDQKSIFDKFYRISTGDIHDVKGFGIGLSYVKGVVEAHNGQVTLDSKLEEGSTFVIKLPLL